MAKFSFAGSLVDYFVHAPSLGSNKPLGQACMATLQVDRAVTVHPGGSCRRRQFRPSPRPCQASRSHGKASMRLY
uniref:Uncharacterized protein n=1 Tax=Oryza glaberrima TaxID=4538 RepID=I1QKR0_ORYGL